MPVALKGFLGFFGNTGEDAYNFVLNLVGYPRLVSWIGFFHPRPLLDHSRSSKLPLVRSCVKGMPLLAWLLGTA